MLHTNIAPLLTRRAADKLEVTNLLEGTVGNKTITKRKSEREQSPTLVSNKRSLEAEMYETASRRQKGCRLFIGGGVTRLDDRARYVCNCDRSLLVCSFRVALLDVFSLLVGKVSLWVPPLSGVALKARPYPFFLEEK